MRKADFCICENKEADQLRGNPKLISAIVFATRIVQSLYFLNPKFQASIAIFSDRTAQFVSDLGSNCCAVFNKD